MGAWVGQGRRGRDEMVSCACATTLRAMARDMGATRGYVERRWRRCGGSGCGERVCAGRERKAVGVSR